MAGKPQRLGALIGEVIQDLGVDRKLDEARAIDAWSEVTGAPINRVTTSVWMNGETLIVKISSGAWRQELHLQRDAWCDRINRHIGKRVVREVRFT